MKKTYLQQLTAIAKRAKYRSFWTPASQIVQKSTGVTRHLGTAY